MSRHLRFIPEGGALVEVTCRTVQGCLLLCLPDSPNVFLEIGLAMGLSRRLQRLIILQKWGPAREDQAAPYPRIYREF